MLFKKSIPPKISLCIPVHNTEKHLGRCLKSIAAQDFSDCEVVLINDCSTGKDEAGRGCKKIARDFQKISKIPVVYIEHFSYVPLLETRRELVEQAHGEYILMIDSDDFLEKSAIQKLYDSAVESGADITCGQDRVYKIIDGQIFISEKRFAVHKEGEIIGRDILDSWLIERTTSAFLWAKLIKRELYLQAFDSIPYMDCSLSVDTPMYFFIAYYAKSYYGIKDVVYYYQENEGITANKEITEMSSWKRNCTIASTFSLLLTFDGNLSEQEKDSIRKLSRHFLRNTILKLRNNVVPELREEAYKLLCEYWGEGYVKTIETVLDKESNNSAVVSTSSTTVPFSK